MRNDLTKAWRELTSDQKREVLKECETAKIVDAREIELIIKEVVEGQRRLF